MGSIRKSGFKLALAGLAGGAFFWLTDPRWGYGTALDGTTASNVIDAMHSATVATTIGLIGSAAVVMGLWIMTRRTA